MVAEELETSNDATFNEFKMQSSELQEQLLNIRVNDKIQVMFNVNDEIFKRRFELPDDEHEELEDWSRCGVCGDSSKKLKGC